MEVFYKLAITAKVSHESKIARLGAGARAAAHGRGNARAGLTGGGWLGRGMARAGLGRAGLGRAGDGPRGGSVGRGKCRAGKVRAGKFGQGKFGQGKSGQGMPGREAMARPDLHGDDRAVPAIDIRALTIADTVAIPRAFDALGWPGKTTALYERYLADQISGSRAVFVAASAQAIAGYTTVTWISGYRPFADAGIPEIQDLNVLPEFRRRGIGWALMDAAEATIAARAPTAGIGVGLYADYAAAHLMYLRRGYLPDGRGLAYRGATVAPGTSVPMDDDLSLMMTRRLWDR
jgi:ribosomal protein S18 acetylase RimI-like enzyme